MDSASTREMVPFDVYRRVYRLHVRFILQLVRHLSHGHGRLAETFLFHLKFLSRNPPQFRRQGMWAVVSGSDLRRS